jgi:hypothetical protein
MHLGSGKDRYELRFNYTPVAGELAAIEPLVANPCKDSS